MAAQQAPDGRARFNEISGKRRLRKPQLRDQISRPTSVLCADEPTG